MICRHYTNGEKLDVANLNELTVLIDRGETALTEVALNTWRAGLVGPPHSHETKEQIFYITSGAGTVVVGEARYAVGPGSLVYVPAEVVHQTIAAPDEALSYLLFNAFLDEQKEGHASYAEHVAIMKGVRKRQAELGKADVDGAAGKSRANSSGKHLNVQANSSREPARRLLLKRCDTSRSEVELVNEAAGARTEPVAFAEKERTLFIVDGSAKVTVAGENETVEVGDIVFIPGKAPYNVEADGQGLRCLSFNTWLVQPDEQETPDQRISKRGRVRRSTAQPASVKV